MFGFTNLDECIGTPKMRDLASMGWASIVHIPESGTDIALFQEALYARSNGHFQMEREAPEGDRIKESRMGAMGARILSSQIATLALYQNTPYVLNRGYFVPLIPEGSLAEVFSIPHEKMEQLVREKQAVQWTYGACLPIAMFNGSFYERPQLNGNRSPVFLPPMDNDIGRVAVYRLSMERRKQMAKTRVLTS